MASSFLHKLVRDHKSPIKLISSLYKPKTPFLIQPLLPNILREPYLEQTLPPNHFNPNLVQFQKLDSIPPKSVPIFPSFSFGYCLNPISSTGSVPDRGGDDGGMMWTDSVKKKRKRKMNKHKLKKLRKRLRRKT